MIELYKRRISIILILLSTILLAIEGTWGVGLQRHWTFLTTAAMLLTALGITIMTDFRNKAFHSVISHLGLFLVLSGGLAGTTSVTDVQMRTIAGGPPEHMAFEENGNSIPLPFSIALQDFCIDCYEDGISPKQFTSTLSVEGRTVRTSVNHPGKYKGYRIYQSGYSTDCETVSILKIVRDPWLPVAAAGALLLALAALLSLKTVWSSWKVLVSALALAVIFTIISLARINLGTLAPALRSLWFIPHLIVYMLAYSILALSVISGIASLFSAKIPASLSRKLLSTASSLLLTGMICGAVWAKQAWGNYWTWDCKECWAAATWFLTLAATHAEKKKTALLFTITAFLAMQMTWYGVNYLPSSGASLHTYNNFIVTFAR